MKLFLTYYPEISDRFRRTKYWGKITSWEIKYIITKNFRVMLFTKAPPKNEKEIFVTYSLKSLLSPDLTDSDIIRGCVNENKFKEILTEFTKDISVSSENEYGIGASSHN
jgi:hypothetical protein